MFSDLVLVFSRCSFFFVLQEHVAGQKLIGLLKQIAQLSDFAGDVFSNLLKDATATSARVGALAGRVAKVEAAVPVVQNIFARSRASQSVQQSKHNSEREMRVRRNEGSSWRIQSDRSLAVLRFPCFVS